MVFYIAMKLVQSVITALLGVMCLSELALSDPNMNLPSTLIPEPQQRDPYNWQVRHERVRQYNRDLKPDYVMIGDSITHYWGGEPSGDYNPVSPATWQKLFNPHIVSNMGFGFDYVDNAYFRVQDGELDGISPRVIIVLLGTNNLGHRKDSPQACADNIKALVRLIRHKCPSSKILLLGILPRQEQYLADPIRQTNQLLAQLDNGRSVFFANPGKAFLSADGYSPKSVYMRDMVHPNAKGYELLAKELCVLLKKLDNLYLGGDAAWKRS